MRRSVELSYVVFLRLNWLNCINCNPVPLWNQEPPSRGALNSRLASVDSGNPVGSGGSRYTVSQRRSGLRGLFSRAEDKVKLSNDEIEQACTRPATVVERYFSPPQSSLHSAARITDSSSKTQSAFHPHARQNAL